MKTGRALLAALVVAALFAGLIESASALESGEEVIPRYQAIPGHTKTVDVELKKEIDPKEVVNGNNAFALDLYAKLSAQEGNLFFSPYSISTALAMTYAGARGNTWDEMKKALHFPLNPTERALHDAFGKLVHDMNAAGKKKGYQLSVANALWAQEDYKFLDEYTGLVTKSYDAGLNKLDFRTATEAARETINKWVEKQTNDKIKDLLKPGVLDPMTRLVLTNAIYFKGDWASKFKKEATQDLPFTLANGEKIKAPLMQQTGEFGYADLSEDMVGGGFRVLEMPYAGDELSMVILLPERIEKFMPTQQNISAWLGVLRKQKVVVFLPKFKMTSEFKLNDTLSALGMKDAFVADKADFSGMDGTKSLFISAVVHKAFVDMNEEGTEAAAATGVVVGVTCMPQAPPVFKADHPFVFLIRDKKTGGILFMGRVMNPVQDER